MYVNVTHPCKGGVVADDAGETNLFFQMEQRQQNRVVDRFLHNFSRSTFCPVGRFERLVDKINVRKRFVVGDEEIILFPLQINPPLVR